MKATITFYRRKASSKTHIYNEHRREGLWYEFEETWYKPDGDELGRFKRRLSQKTTGKVFRFVNHVSPEYLQDNPKAARGVQLQIMLPEDFTILQLNRVR